MLPSFSSLVAAALALAVLGQAAPALNIPMQMNKPSYEGTFGSES
ncbi:hypothetical protein BB8028_0005g01560 [Beauveria bassiana]|uniref:Uncharacterized protein n=1 Tax=Beauveria bassiana TaxID=176275 RepID=A0A2S7YEP0_BEABA|nr:hypothetical protein BB8028_0005g01560 [Beauveria bassiana]